MTEDIEALQAAGAHTQAIAALDARLVADPDDARAWYLRARSHAALGRPSRLVADLQRAVARDGDVIARAAADPVFAAYRTNPFVVLALELDLDLTLAADALRDGEVGEALGLLEEHRDDPVLGGAAWFLVGVCRSQLGDPIGTLDASEHVVARLPAFSDGWFNRGWALEELGRMDEALAAYGRSIEVDPEFGNGWFNLAMLHRRLGHDDEALRTLDAAVGADPTSALLGYKRAEALVAAGRLDEAVAQLQAVIARDPGARDAIADSDVFRAAFDAATLSRLTAP